MIVLLLSLLVSVARADSGTIRIAFGSCAHQDSTQEIWARVQAWDPDLFVHLGDAVYADTHDPAEMRSAYDRAGRNAHFRELRESVPFFSTWDDHDYGENDAGASYRMKEDAQKLFFEFWSHQGDPDRESRSGVYGSRTIRSDGGSVQIILLDTRYFRSDWTRDTGGRRRYRQDQDSSKTLLGPRQWTWLERQLHEEANVRVIASSIQVINDEHGWECWGNFPRERRRLFDLIRSSGAEGVIVLSGDRHFSELSTTGSGLDYPLYDFTSSGLTQVARTGHTVPNSKRVGRAVAVQNFSGLRVDFPNRRITFQVVDRRGETQFEHVVTLDELRPQREE